MASLTNVRTPSASIVINILMPPFSAVLSPELVLETFQTASQGVEMQFYSTFV